MAALTSAIASTISGTILPTTSHRKRILTSVFPMPTAEAKVTTYYYRQTNGTRGSTTSTGGIPVGAVVERIVTV